MLIVTGGLRECWDTLETLITDAKDGMIKIGKSKKASLFGHLFPIIIPQWTHLMWPAPPDNKHLLGTDDTARDVLTRVIYGFRLSVLFAVIVSVLSSVIGILMGAVQGYFGGRIDLLRKG